MLQEKINTNFENVQDDTDTKKYCYFVQRLFTENLFKVDHKAKKNACVSKALKHLKKDQLEKFPEAVFFLSKKRSYNDYLDMQNR